jgi:hypothetical protein
MFTIARAQSTVLVPDPTNNRVFRYNIDTGGNWSFAGIFGSASDGSNMFNPQAVVYDAANSAVYIGESDSRANTGASRILKYSVNGTFQSVLTTFATTGERVDKMMLGPDGNLLVSDPFGTNFVSDQIIKVNVSSGAYSTFISPGDPLFLDPYQLINPRSLAIAGGNLYITNRNGMGASTGSLVRFNATTGAYVDVNVGANAASINDDVFLDIDEAIGLAYDDTANTLYISNHTAADGPDVYAINLSTVGAPPLTTASPGITKVLDLTGGNRNLLGMRIVDGQLYTTAFTDDRLYKIVPGSAGNPAGSLIQVLAINDPNDWGEIPYQAAAPVGTPWDRTGFGDWNTTANWLGGLGAPNSNAAVAIFGSTITADSTIFADAGVTVQTLRFDSAFKYAIAGNGSLTLAAASGGALIDVDSGAHAIQLPVTLMANATITVSPGASLTLDGRLNLNGFTLTYSGNVAFNGRVFKGGGALVPAGAGASAAVPEPGVAMSSLAAAIVLFSRRRRKRS